MRIAASIVASVVALVAAAFAGIPSAGCFACAGCFCSTPSALNYTGSGSITVQTEPTLESGTCDPPPPADCKVEKDCKVNGTLTIINNLSGDLWWANEDGDTRVQLDPGDDLTAHFSNHKLICSKSSSNHMDYFFWLAAEGGNPIARYTIECSRCWNPVQ